jgi:hypothetical protein
MDEAVAGHATASRSNSAPTAFDRHRQRPRHPGRPAPEIQEQVGARSHHDHAACRRQVRRQGLRDLGRPARRRRLGRQRAVGRPGGRGRARPPALPQRFSRGIPQGSWRKLGEGPQPPRHADASIRIPRSSAKARTFEPARLYRMARSKAYLFGGVEIRWKLLRSRR